MNQYGLIGKKLGHSISPSIHDEIFKGFNICGQYKLYEIAPSDLENTVQKFKSIGMKGINVTIPYKADIMPFIDEISSEALNIGAVNTIKFQDNKLKGYNTDYYGVKITFDKNCVTVKDRSAVILGSGGASAAVVQYLLDAGCADITFVVRDIIRAKASNSRLSNFKVITYDEIDSINNKQILINCTPSGMFPKIDEAPVKRSFLQGFSFVFDLIYNPKETFLLKYAKDSNIKYCNGLYMLVGQAVAAEGIWNNIKVDLDVVDKIFKIIDEKVI